jgi:DNA-binding transcriptional regulator/RsmH inhibitor MraZ
MSGDTVRRAAVQGQTEMLKRLFASGANPCECDEVSRLL